jgi:MFS family permease
MKLFAGKGKNNKDSSLGIFHSEAASSSVENASIAYQSPSIIAAGASPSGVALLSTLTNLVLAVLLLKVPSLIEGPRSSTKRTTIILAVTNCATWVPIVFLMLFMNKISPLLLTGLWIINIVPAVLAGPLRDSWLANIAPAEKMGSYLSSRAMIAGVFYLASYYVMGLILDTSTGRGNQGYFIVMAFALASSIYSAIVYTRVKPPSQPAVKDNEASIGFLTFLKQAKGSHLGVFILFVAMFTFAVNLSSPLFASYMLQDLKFSYMTFTVIISSEYIARILSLAFWGKMIDKSGSLKVLGLVTYLIPFVPILWLFSQNFVYLIVVQLFSGVVWAAFDLAVQTFIFKATKPEQRLRYIVYYKSLHSFSVALGAIFGALMLSHMIPVFGSQILGLFLISGIIRLVVARIMLPKLTPEGIPNAIVHEELATELAAMNIPILPQGLYYHPELWSRFSKRAYIIGSAIGKTIGIITPSRPGLYYNPQKWSEYSGKKQRKQFANLRMNNDTTLSKKGIYYKQREWTEYVNRVVGEQMVAVNASNTSQSTTEGLFDNPQAQQEYLKNNGISDLKTTNNNSQIIRDGLFYHPEEWKQKQAELAKVVVNTGKEKISREGIFHKPEHWADYMKRSLVLNATTMHSGSEGVTLRQPVFYHPEIWGKYKEETVLSRDTTKQKATTRKALLQYPEEWQGYTAQHANPKNRRTEVQVGSTMFVKSDRLPGNERRAQPVAGLSRNTTVTTRLSRTTPPTTTRRLRTTPSLV